MLNTPEYSVFSDRLLTPRQHAVRSITCAASDAPSDEVVELLGTTVWLLFGARQSPTDFNYWQTLPWHVQLIVLRHLSLESQLNLAASHRAAFELVVEHISSFATNFRHESLFTINLNRMQQLQCVTLDFSGWDASMAVAPLQALELLPPSVRSLTLQLGAQCPPNTHVSSSKSNLEELYVTAHNSNQFYFASLHNAPKLRTLVANFTRHDQSNEDVFGSVCNYMTLLHILYLTGPATLFCSEALHHDKYVLPATLEQVLFHSSGELCAGLRMKHLLGDSRNLKRLFLHGARFSLDECELPALVELYMGDRLYEEGVLSDENSPLLPALRRLNVRSHDGFSGPIHRDAYPVKELNTVSGGDNDASADIIHEMAPLAGTVEVWSHENKGDSFTELSALHFFSAARHSLHTIALHGNALVNMAVFADLRHTLRYLYMTRDATSYEFEGISNEESIAELEALCELAIVNHTFEVKKVAHACTHLRSLHYLCMAPTVRQSLQAGDAKHIQHVEQIDLNRNVAVSDRGLLRSQRRVCGTGVLLERCRAERSHAAY